MEYQIILSPDLDLSPAGFVASWNEEAAAHNLPQARRSSMPSIGRL